MRSLTAFVMAMPMLAAACSPPADNEKMTGSAWGLASLLRLPPPAETLNGMNLVREADIATLVIGKRVDGGMAAYYHEFHPGGRYLQFEEFGFVRRGRWVITQDALCIVLPVRGGREPVRCRRFYRAPDNQVFQVFIRGHGGPVPLIIMGDLPASR